MAGLDERKAGYVAQKVFLDVGRISSEEHEVLLYKHGVHLEDRRFVPVGLKVVPVDGRVVLTGHRVVPLGT